MEKKTIFGAFLVYASKQETETTYGFRLSPGSAPERWVYVDLTKNPESVLSETIPWEDVLIDTGQDDSATRLTGWWADFGFIGVAYLSSKCMTANKLELPPPLPPPLVSLAKAHEYQTVLYAPDSSVRPERRYYGFHARITKKRKDEQDHHLGLVSVYHAGSSQDPDEEPASTFWIDFSDPNAPYDFQASSIDIGNHHKWEGSLFVEQQLSRAKKLQLRFPSTVLRQPKGSNPTLELVEIKNE